MLTDNNFDEVYPLVRGWIEKGEFKHNGYTFKRGINDWSAAEELAKLVTLRITDLAHWFDELMCTGTAQPASQPKALQSVKANLYVGILHQCQGAGPINAIAA
jgi:hypothetical protein